MTNILKGSGSRVLFTLVMALLVLTNLSVFLDIPVLRQVFSFIFLTFVPGFLFLYISKLDKLGWPEKIVLSVGLSLAFLMFFGLLVNSSLLAIGYTKPLSTISLLVSFSAATIILAVIAYTRNKGTVFSFSGFKLTAREKAFLIVPSIFPLLSIIGMRIMNLTDNNAVLMLLLFMIPAYVIFISFSNRKVPERVYPAAIFLISISLLLMYSLRSNHIIGSDTHREMFILQTILDNLYWSRLGFGLLDATLSISLLPAIYQTFLHINLEYLLKLLPSLIISILPLVVYLLSKKYIGSFYAFLASVFFMSQVIFQWTPSYTRTNIAILFFGLAILVMFHDGISELRKKALFIIFAAAIIMSHYGVTYIAFFALLFTWIGMQILSIIASRRKKVIVLSAKSPAVGENPSNFSSPGEPPQGDDDTAYKATAPDLSQTWLRRGITITVVIIFLVMLFLWYNQSHLPTFAIGVRTIYSSFAGWEWFLAEGTGGAVVQSAMGKTLAYTGVAQRIEFVFSWLTVILMSIGLSATLWRFKGMIFNPRAGHRKPTFLLRKFELAYLMLSIGCYLLLVASVVLPNVSKIYGVARVYFQMMVPLSIFFVIGGIEAARYLKARPHWVILAVLIPYFLSTTGVVPQMFDYPRAITLNSEGPLYNMYISDGESYAAKWIGEYSEEGTTIYANDFALEVLLSQGLITRHYMPGARAYQFGEDKEMDGYIYLRYLDIADGGLVAKYPGVFAEKSKVYTNGKSEIYK